MHAVILAAGRSTRTLPLTATKPKPLLRAANVSILEHNLRQLAGLVDAVTIVVGYGREQIEAEVQRLAPHRLRIAFAAQKEQKGTGNALRAAGELPERFLVLNGDDFYARNDLAQLLKHDQGILAAEVKDEARLRMLGVLSLEGERLVRIEEKPAKPKSTLVYTGCAVLKKSVLAAPAKRSARGEEELTDLINAVAAAAPISTVRAAFWHPVSYPWQLLDANEALLAQQKRSIAGSVEKGATILGAVSIGKGTRIRAGAYIEGPVAIGSDCDIGPNCSIRPGTSIGNSCRIGNGVEVKNSILGERTHAAHLSYIGDSVLGDAVNIGGGTMIANLRHDGATVRSVVNGKLVDSGRRKLGAILGDGAKTGANSTILPGRKLWPGTATRPGELVDKDKLR